MDEPSVELLDGLDAIRELPDETWKKILDNAFASLLGKPDIHSSSALFGGSKPDSSKRAYAALLSVVASTSRNGSLKIDENVRERLSPARREQLDTIYEKNRERLFVRVARLGTAGAPHITDCRWRLEHVIKTSELDETCGPVYRVELVTDVYDQQTDGRNTKSVHFTCNVQQLHDLVYKLKDAVRHCDRISSVQ